MLQPVPGYDLSDVFVSDSLDFVLMRGIRQRDGHPVLIKTVRPGRSPAVSGRLSREFELIRRIESPLVVQALELIVEGNGPSALVLEDFGGMPLTTHRSAPLAGEPFFAIALALVDAMTDIHRARVVHKNLSAETILVSADGTEVKITDFSLAFAMPRVLAGQSASDVIEGAWATMAPEQTGRMNRVVDHRSDLYSLGVIFYEQLTGHPPFQAEDLPAWIHAHLARSPRPPQEWAPWIPACLAAMVLRLLAKQPEERYQSAWGLRMDLDHCRALWRAGQGHVPFVLGSGDVPERLPFPQKLYGREESVANLRAALTRVTHTGQVELALVSGYSGVGKSSLVNELRQTVIEAGGRFITGKFDAQKRVVPYATMAQAFQGLITELLTESEASLARWRSRVTQALGNYVALLSEIVPVLNLLLGSSPSVPVAELPPSEAQNRFLTILRRFVAVFATPEHPLVLFLDDMQWADIGSLRLVQDLATVAMPLHLLLIGAYRDNEVSPSHPLTLALAAARSNGAIVSNIVLVPLNEADVCAFMSDTLHCPPAKVAPLAKLLHTRTAGNPFFLIQILGELEQEGLITFDPPLRRWRWDSVGIETREIPDSVLGLLTDKMLRLPAVTREVLMYASCFGNTVDLRVLAMGLGWPIGVTEHHLAEAIDQGLMMRVGNRDRFAHDRVQEAAYALLPIARRAALHLGIGRLLMAHFLPLDTEQWLFIVADQFSRCLDLIEARSECIQLATLFLAAGRKAATATAHESAATYLTAGMTLAGTVGWNDCRALTYDLHLERARADYLRGAFDESERLLSMLLDAATSITERVLAIRLGMAVYTTHGAIDRAIALGLEGLALFNIALPSHPNRAQVDEEFANVWSTLGTRRIKDLIDLPEMQSSDMRLAMDLLCDLGTPAIFGRPALLHVTTARMIVLTMQYGATNASIWAYLWFGATLVQRSFRRYQDGYHFGRLAYDFMERKGASAFRAKVCLTFGDNINFYAHPLREDRDFILDAFRAATESGDLPWGCYSCNHLITNLLSAGDPLDEVWHETERRLDFVRRAKDPNIEDIIVSQQRFIQLMRGQTFHWTTFSSAQFDQDDFEARIRNSQMPLIVCWYYILKLQARFLFGDIEGATAAATEAGRLILTSGPDIQGIDYDFFAALVLSARCRTLPPEQLHEALALLDGHLVLLREWAESCPANFHNRLALVLAERASLLGDALAAERLYEQAIGSAHENGFIHQEALASELAAGFYRERGFDRIADTYLCQARDGYARWGAAGKVRHLEACYPQLVRVEAAVLGSATSLTVATNQADLLSMLKAAQSISGELELPRLQEALLRIALEQAGAQCGLLLLAHDGEMAIHARATSGEGGAETRVERIPAQPVASGTLLQALLATAQQRLRTVILADAVREGPFVGLPDVIHHRPRSVLCLPIARGSKLVGALYLENNLLAGIFSPDKLPSLELLASQAAITLEIAEAQTALSASEERFRRLFEENKAIQVLIDPANGRIVDANRSALQYYGYRRERLCAMTIFEINTLDPVTIRARMDSILSREQDFFPFQHRLASGEIRDVEVYSGPIDFSGQRLLCSTIQDVTARRQAEAARNRLAAIVESSNDAIIGESIDGTVISWNQGAETLYGYSAPEILGHAVHVLTPPECAGEVIELMERVMRGETVTNHETIRKRKDGVLLSVSLTLSPIRDEQGTLIGLSAIAHDITQRKKTEAELQHYRENLESLVAQRTAALTESNHQLAIAKEKAEAANSAKSIFLANMSHEIRTPMNAILGFTQIMQRSTTLNAEDRENVEIIARAGRNLLTLINDILEMSKIEAGRMEFTPGSCDLGALLDDLYLMFKVVTDAKGLYWDPILDPNLPRWIVTDEGKLRQILINLLGNAVKFTDEGGVVLRAHAAAADGGWRLQIDVEDSGSGITPSDQQRLFEAFQQAASGADRGGTGLGLALSRRYAWLMGGDVTMTSTPGRGSIFRLMIPVAPGTAVGKPSARAHRRVIRVRSGGDPFRILIADDRADNRLFLRRLLEPLGFRLCEAANGREALAVVAEWRPHLVLMDIVMPVMGGHEAIRALRASPEGRDVLIIALSASAFDEDRAAVLASGADDFVRKPVTAEFLLETIRALAGLAYDYAEDVQNGEESPTTTGAVTLRPDMKSRLPTETLHAMSEAVYRGDDIALATLIDGLPTMFNDIAEALRHVLSEFDWDTLEDFFGTPPGLRPGG